MWEMCSRSLALGTERGLSDSIRMKAPYATASVAARLFLCNGSTHLVPRRSRLSGSRMASSKERGAVTGWARPVGRGLWLGCKIRPVSDCVVPPFPHLRAAGLIHRKRPELVPKSLAFLGAHRGFRSRADRRALRRALCLCVRGQAGMALSRGLRRLSLLRGSRIPAVKALRPIGRAGIPILSACWARTRSSSTGTRGTRF
jgi:hypothetical protein